jgi:arsenate reductase (thioredoxin)
MKILFMCVANSARSQLAEAIAKQIFGNSADIRSAGSRPATVNPFAIRALKEINAETQNLSSKAVENLPRDFVEGIDFVITLCAEEVCPVIITKAKKLHWPMPDPAGKNGTDEDHMNRFRDTRDQLKSKLAAFAKDLGLT